MWRAKPRPAHSSVTRSFRRNLPEGWETPGRMHAPVVCCERELHNVAARPAAGNYTMKIAIQGELGSFSHEAALKLVSGAEILPRALSAEVFAALDVGAVDAAAIPIENSLAGSV